MPEPADLPEAINIRRLGAGDWERLREFRLRALADAPLAFGSTLARERELPDGTWRRRALGSDQSRMFVAQTGAGWVGFAGWVREPDGSAQLISMWVVPGWRRRGVATALVRWVVETHLRDGQAQLRLWVSAENLGARLCYEACGFRLTGRSQPLPSAPELDELEMSFRGGGETWQCRRPLHRG